MCIVIIDDNKAIFVEDGVSITNTTPQSVSIIGRTGDAVLTIPAAREPLRLVEASIPVGEFCGIPLARTVRTIDPETPLPPRREGAYYIVSPPIAQAVQRGDFLVPDDLVWDRQGKVIGCRRLAVLT